jgi:hypothetical protein
VASSSSSWRAARGAAFASAAFADRFGFVALGRRCRGAAGAAGGFRFVAAWGAGAAGAAASSAAFAAAVAAGGCRVRRGFAARSGWFVVWR